ncbi:ATP-binding protein [Ruminococcus sp. NK3A76]|uniref:ATP-binding protein n=1 Tax=Ruminococcus sp. NK3A76 TaxID=877411 RepID=UPI00048D94C4|nr:ATP-binding protein [Ruminococcus sp. NK3A76]
MIDTELRKSLAAAAAMFESSRRGIMITDENYRLKWTNDIDLAKGKFMRDASGCAVRRLNETIPLMKTEITLGGEPFYLFSRYDENDLLSYMRSDKYNQLYESFSAKLYVKAAHYLELSKIITDPVEEKQLSDGIKKQNISLLSGYINACELRRLIDLSDDLDLHSVRYYLRPFLDNTAHIAKKNRYEFTYELEKELFLRSDMKVLLCVIANLIANAYLHNKSENKKAHIRIYKENGRFCIHMTDNGGGIDMKIAEQTKKPFLIKNDGGEGLGLYMARLYTARCGGEISLSNENGGLSIHIALSPELTQEPIDLRSPPYIHYTTLLDTEYLILAKGLDTFESNCF